MKTLVKPYGLKNYGFLLLVNGLNFFRAEHSKKKRFDFSEKTEHGRNDINKGIEIINKYINLWNERNFNKRKIAIEETYSEDFLFTDPNFSIIGRDMLNRHISNFQADTPNALFFVEEKSIIVENEIVSFRWRLKNRDGKIISSGLDAITLKNNQIEALDVYVDKK